MADRRNSGRRSGGGDGAVVDELGLRLWTGSSSLSAEATPTRSWMTILYGGRMCSVQVTQLQAMEIITMASQQILTKHQQYHGSRDHRDGQPDSSSGSTTTTTEQQPAPAQLQRRGSGSPPASSSPSCHQATGGVMGALGTISHEATAPGLSMKRSLQRFLLKRKTRAAATVASPYAGARAARPTRLTI